MKTRITIALSALLLCICISAPAHQKTKEDWKKKVESEKIAFLTMETGMTPEEAQAFWPVYNKIGKEREEAMFETFRAYKELDQALDADKPVNEIEVLLEKYTKAQEKQRQIDNRLVSEYKKVLPVDKVAKLVIGEEKFRRQHIRKLHGGGDKPAPKN